MNLQEKKKTLELNNKVIADTELRIAELVNRLKKLRLIKELYETEIKLAELKNEIQKDKEILFSDIKII